MTRRNDITITDDDKLVAAAISNTLDMAAGLTKGECHNAWCHAVALRERATEELGLTASEASMFWDLRRRMED